MQVSVSRPRSVLASFVSLICLLMCLGLSAQAQRYSYARDIVARAQEDLRRAASFTRESKGERERYEKAQKHLSEFDRSLTRGKFDGGKLNDVIDDVKDIVEHNTLAAGDRDALTQDLHDLRDLKSHHEK